MVLLDALYLEFLEICLFGGWGGHGCGFVCLDFSFHFGFFFCMKKLLVSLWLVQKVCTFPFPLLPAGLQYCYCSRSSLEAPAVSQ